MKLYILEKKFYWIGEDPSDVVGTGIGCSKAITRMPE